MTPMTGWTYKIPDSTGRHDDQIDAVSIAVAMLSRVSITTCRT